MKSLSHAETQESCPQCKWFYSYSSHHILFNNIFTADSTYFTVRHIYTNCTWQQIRDTLSTLCKWHEWGTYSLNVNTDFQLTPEHNLSSPHHEPILQLYLQSHIIYNSWVWQLVWGTFSKVSSVSSLHTLIQQEVELK